MSIHMETILRQIRAAEAKGAVNKKRLPPSTPKTPTTPKKRKDTIPVALREAIWLHHMGRQFEGKCKTTWCKNSITVFDFQAGHDQPESKGGPTTFENLIPICARCNLSMGNRYTFGEWCKLSESTARLATKTAKVKRTVEQLTAVAETQPTVPEVKPHGCCSMRW